MSHVNPYWLPFRNPVLIARSSSGRCVAHFSSTTSKIFFLFFRKESNAIIIFPTMRYGPSRIHRYLTVQDSQAIAKRHQRTVVVERRGAHFSFSATLASLFSISFGVSSSRDAFQTNP